MNDETFKREILKIQAAQARALNRIASVLEQLVDQTNQLKEEDND